MTFSVIELTTSLYTRSNRRRNQELYFLLKERIKSSSGSEQLYKCGRPECAYYVDTDTNTRDGD